MSPYRNECFVDLGELIRENNFDYVGVEGKRLPHEILEVDPPHLRDTVLTPVSHPSDYCKEFRWVSDELTGRGYRLASAHALLRWALTADIHLKKHQRFHIASVSRFYPLDIPKPSESCPDFVWSGVYVPCVHFRCGSESEIRKEFTFMRSHSESYISLPSPSWKYMVHKR